MMKSFKTYIREKYATTIVFKGQGERNETDRHREEGEYTVFINPNKSELLQALKEVPGSAWAGLRTSVRCLIEKEGKGDVYIFPGNVVHWSGGNKLEKSLGITLKKAVPVTIEMVKKTWRISTDYEHSFFPGIPARVFAKKIELYKQNIIDNPKASSILPHKDIERVDIGA